MEIINLLDFTNNINSACSLKYDSSSSKLVNYLGLLTEDEQFTRKIDLGIFFVSQVGVKDFIIVDGMGKLLSISLLLHAVCECYKKTSTQNEKAINTIRNKYLISGDKTKIKLAHKEQVIYEKIIFGERLSGHEKQSELFMLLHDIWSQIKINEYEASRILKMLQKVQVVAIETHDLPLRDFYYSLNKSNEGLNHLLLIEDFLNEKKFSSEWNSFVKIFNKNNSDIKTFFRNYFITKLHIKEYNDDRLYDLFTNYFETMLGYIDYKKLFDNLKKSAQIFNDIININFENKKIKDIMIKIKMHRGEDTFGYIMNIYDDYLENRISESTLIDILITIDEYLQNRTNSSENISFNELIQYLNVLISCK